LKINPLSLF